MNRQAPDLIDRPGAWPDEGLQRMWLGRGAPTPGNARTAATSRRSSTDLRRSPRRWRPIEHGFPQGVLRRPGRTGGEQLLVSAPVALLIIWAMEGATPGAAGGFLEIGCGTGYVLGGIRAALPATEAHRAARSSPPASTSRRTGSLGASFYQIDARSLPYRGRVRRDRRV